MALDIFYSAGSVSNTIGSQQLSALIRKKV